MGQGWTFKEGIRVRVRGARLACQCCSRMDQSRGSHLESSSLDELCNPTRGAHNHEGLVDQNGLLLAPGVGSPDALLDQLARLLGEEALGYPNRLHG